MVDLKKRIEALEKQAALTDCSCPAILFQGDPEPPCCRVHRDPTSMRMSLPRSAYDVIEVGDVHLWVDACLRATALDA